MKESDVGAVVISYLKELRQEVYCEVDSMIGRIDIVAVAPEGLITAIELKKSLSFDVLGQAIHRSRFAHRSVAAAPFPKDMNHKWPVIHSVHSEHGIGIWNVREGRVREEFPANIQRDSRYVDKYIRDCLCDEQKDQKAGVNMGFWSPFQQTKNNLIRYVRENPGCTIKDAVKGVKHHYGSNGSAYSSLAKWIREGVISEVELRDHGLFLPDSEVM